MVIVILMMIMIVLVMMANILSTYYLIVLLQNVLLTLSHYYSIHRKTLYYDFFFEIGILKLRELVQIHIGNKWQSLNLSMDITPKRKFETMWH